MKYLRKFNENVSIYDTSWQTLLPYEIWVIKGDDGRHQFKKGNIMTNSDMLQICYDNAEHGIPDTLEFDIYFSNLGDKFTDRPLSVKSGGFTTNGSLVGDIRLNVDITYGDLMACEFSIDKQNGLKLIEMTTYGSKFDPSDTVFGFDKEGLQSIVNFLNRFNHNVKLKIDDFYFLTV
jgi:hypothetical protein